MKSAAIWGPFVLHQEWEKVAFLMWEKLLKQLPFSLSKVHGFYNLHNKNSEDFMGILNAVRQSEHCILKFTRGERQFAKEKIITITEMTEDYLGAFKDLHHESFKQAFLSASEIYMNIDQYKKVFIATTNEFSVLSSVS